MFTEILQNHSALKKRQEKAIQQIAQVKTRLEGKIACKRYEQCTIFCAGSLGREDFGKKSDLDLFIVSEQRSSELKRLDSLILFADLITVNDTLGFPRFSNDAQYIVHHY